MLFLLPRAPSARPSEGVKSCIHFSAVFDFPPPRHGQFEISSPGLSTAATALIARTRTRTFGGGKHAEWLGHLQFLPSLTVGGGLALAPLDTRLRETAVEGVREGGGGGG